MDVDLFLGREFSDNELSQCRSTPQLLPRNQKLVGGKHLQRISRSAGPETKFGTLNRTAADKLSIDSSPGSGMIKYLNGLEAGDFRDREFLDRQEYSVRSGYMDDISEAADLEIQLQLRILVIDRLRRASPVVAPPVNPPIQQVQLGQHLKLGCHQPQPINQAISILIQADLNAHQEVGSDHPRDDIPSPSGVCAPQQQPA